MKIKIYDQIITDITASINAGTLKPGDKLPTYPELAKQYNTSAVTVRKSIAKLITQGYLYSVERIGIFVRERERDLFLISFSPQANINEEVTHTSIEGISLTLAQIKGNTEQKAVEIRFIGYSDTIPVYYTIITLYINGRYDISHLSDMAEKNLLIILNFLDSFDIKKSLSITMDAPKGYIQDKLLIDTSTPIVCINTDYTTLKGYPVGKAVTWVAGENIDFFGKSIMHMPQT